MPPIPLSKDICDYHRKNPHINVVEHGNFINPKGIVSREIRRACDQQFPASKKTLIQRVSASIRRKKDPYSSVDIRWFVATYRMYIYVNDIPSHYTFEGTTHPIEDIAYMLFLSGFNTHAEDIIEYKKGRKLYNADYIKRLADNIEESNAIPYSWYEKLHDLGSMFFNRPESHIVQNYKQTPPTRDECASYRSDPKKDPRHRVTFVNENDFEYLRDTCISQFPVEGITFQGRAYTNEQVKNELFEYGRANLYSTWPYPPLIEFISRIYKHTWVVQTIHRGQDAARNENMSHFRSNRSKSKPSSATRSHRPRSVSSASETLPANEHTCSLYFRDVLESSTLPQYKSFVRKMTKRCTEVIDKCVPRDIRSKIAGELNHFTGFDDVINIDSPSHALQETFKGKLVQFKKLSHIPRIRYAGQDGMGSGVFNDYITNCLAEAKKLFAPIHETSQRYAIHPDMSPAYAAKLGYGDNLTDEDVCRLYELVGGLFAYCARRNIPIPFYFARMILAKIVYSKIPTDMSVLYYMLEEDSQTRSSILSLMKEPQNIEYAYMQMNDVFPLVDSAENTDVTADNFIPYLDMYSRHMYWKQLKLHKKDSIVAGNDTSKYLDAFIRGFHIRKQLRKEKVQVRELDDMLSDMRISYDNIMAWLENNNSISLIHNDTVYSRPGLEQSPGNIEKQREIFAWFMEILREGGKTLPLAYMKENAPKLELKNKKDAFIEFFKKLMLFWSSFPHINTNDRYTISVKYSDAGYPTSATCFKTIHLSQTINSKKQLYELLIYTIFNVNMGIDLV